jgi:hypothetical protein
VTGTAHVSIDVLHPDSDDKIASTQHDIKNGKSVILTMVGSKNICTIILDLFLRQYLQLDKFKLMFDKYLKSYLVWTQQNIGSLLLPFRMASG